MRGSVSDLSGSQISAKTAATPQRPHEAPPTAPQALAGSRHGVIW